MGFCGWVLVAVQDDEYFQWVFLDGSATKTQQAVLFEPLSSFATHVVVVRLPAEVLPSRLPVPCCMLATVAMTAPEISWSQVGSRDGGRVPIGGWPVMWVIGVAVVGGVCRPRV